MKGPTPLLLAFCCLLLSSCMKVNERDPVALDTLRSPYLFETYIDISVNEYGYRHYSVIVQAEISNGDQSINADSTTYFLNGVPMQYSIGVGNYYDRYPSFKMEFDEGDKLRDTLQFKVMLRDSSVFEVGFFYLLPVMKFIQNKNFYTNPEPGKNSALVVNWGGEFADYVSVTRTVTKQQPSGLKMESELVLEQKCKPADSFALPLTAFKVDSGYVNNIDIMWKKQSVGVITNEKIGGSILGTAHVTQRIQVDGNEK
jgi:hypothetical protein